MMLDPLGRNYETWLWPEQFVISLVVLINQPISTVNLNS